MTIPPFLKSIIGDGAAKIGESIKGIIDESKFSAEEKAEIELKMAEVINKHSETMATLAEQETEAYLKDTQSAREANARIQESERASWLAKNMAYCLDITLVLAFISMLVIIIFRVVPENNKELFYTAFGLLGGYVSTVINFHRGTSAGSKASGDTLRNILRK
jgi:hypothetical protein